jgi:hypothetical protein
LRVERLDSAAGFKTVREFLMAPGATLVLTADADGRLNASIGTSDVSSSFVNLDGTRPARLPEIPEARSEWQFRAVGGVFDLSTFDAANTFELPTFQVELSRVRLQRLTFDVQVPFFLQQTVADLARQHGFQGELLVYEGLPPDRIQEVINQVCAAGVRGNLRFSLNFFENHAASERFSGLARHRATENADATDSLLASNINRFEETQRATESFALGGVFDCGTLSLLLLDRAGHVAHESRHKNRIVRTGRQLVAQLFGGVAAGTPPTQVSHMALGTDGTAPADAQTGLLAERDPRKPIAEVVYSDFDEAQPGGGTVRRVRASLRAVFDFNEANGPEPLREAGIFTSGAAGGGIMYNRVVFDPVTKTNAFQLTLLWEITF